MGRPDHIQHGVLPEGPPVDVHGRNELGFHMLPCGYSLLDDRSQRSFVKIDAQLEGLFFPSSSKAPFTTHSPPRSLGLTCYRRNQFQVTGLVTLPRNLRYVDIGNGCRMSIAKLELAVSATDSLKNNAVKIISAPRRRPTKCQADRSEGQVEQEPTAIPLHKWSEQQLGTNYPSIPIQWDKLQFKVATANNGRRLARQQQFFLHIKIVASLSTGGDIAVAEAVSCAVTVRGRGPKHYTDHGDVMLSRSPRARARSHTSQANVRQTLFPINSTPRIKSSANGVLQMTADRDDSSNADQSVPPGEAVWMAQPLGASLAATYSVTKNPAPMPMFIDDPMPELGTPMQNVPVKFWQDMLAGENGPSRDCFSVSDDGDICPLGARGWPSCPPTLFQIADSTNMCHGQPNRSILPSIQDLMDSSATSSKLLDGYKGGNPSSVCEQQGLFQRSK